MRRRHKSMSQTLEKFKINNPEIVYQPKLN